MPDPLPILRRLPAGTGVVFRHYGIRDRESLARRVAAEARSRRLFLLMAADWRLASRVGADGIHLPEGLARSGLLAPLRLWARRRGRTLTMACHSPTALALARNLGIHAVLLSPVFPTASHPGAPVIGATRFRLWVRRGAVPAYALGGITTRRHRILGRVGLAALSGW